MTQLSVSVPSSAALVLSPEQSRARDAVLAWHQKRDKPFYKLFGIAGVGKTFLAAQIAKEIGGAVGYVSYTGRACDVMRRKGMPARTIHSALYLPMSERNDELDKLRAELQDADGPKAHRLVRRIEALSSPQFILRSSDPNDPRGCPLARCSLIIADEMSMISKQEADDLLSFKVPLLVLGDPGQLPPIEGRGFFSTGQPDFLLTEIHRQALDSPILRLANDARLRRPLKLGQYGSSLVVFKRDITPAMICSVDQVLTGSNKTRLQLTADIREFRGFSGTLPRQGEKLICLRNNPRSGLFNGSELVMTADCYDDPDHGYFIRVPTDKGEFKAYRDCFERPERLKAMPYNKRAAADEFDFAWALTVHKAQGGQWPSVMFWDDGMFRWDGALYSQLRYTAVSRAEEKIIIAV